MSSKFDVNDLNATPFIIGMEMKRDRVGRKIWLNHSKYVETMLSHFNMQGCKLVKALLFP